MEKQSFQPKLSMQNVNCVNINTFTTSNSEYLYTPTQYLISSNLFFTWPKDFLTSKKTIQDNLITTLKSIADIRSNPQMNAGQLREQLKTKRKELEGIKRKLNKSCEQQTQVYDIMKKRVHRHQTLSGAGIKGNINQLNSQVNSDQFSLELNKQIAYFMVDESIKREKKLDYQQRLKQQLKQHKQTQPHTILSQGELQQSYDTSKDIHNNLQALRRPIATDILPFTFIQQLSPNRIEIPLPTTESQLMDIQRLFSMPEEEHLEMMYELQQPQNSFFLRLRDYISETARHPLLRAKNSKDSEKRQQNNASKKVELGYTKKDLFDERKFIQTIDKETLGRSQGRMVVQQENYLKSDYQINKQQRKSVDHKSVISNSLSLSSFQDQIQLQCTLYRKQSQISHHILGNNLTSVTQFLYQNTHMVNKSNSHLQFWLTLCKAIELIATKIETEQMKALQLIRNMVDKLTSRLENWHKEELEKVTCMLLMPQEKISIQPYLKKTQQSFRAVFQHIYKLPDFTAFLHTIYTGALILKTPTCIEKDKENPLICPLCNPLAEKVFVNVPLLTRNQSNLICRINGSVMDHENYPIMLPSYQIYSLKGLQDTKKRTKTGTGKVLEEYYCKFTQTWYNKQLAKKVFLA